MTGIRRGVFLKCMRFFVIETGDESTQYVKCAVSNLRQSSPCYMQTTHSLYRDDPCLINPFQSMLRGQDTLGTRISFLYKITSFGPPGSKRTPENGSRVKMLWLCAGYDAKYNAKLIKFRWSLQEVTSYFLGFSLDLPQIQLGFKFLVDLGGFEQIYLDLMILWNTSITQFCLLFQILSLVDLHKPV